jgi:tripartite-type tricarboxylate transporter receptor subunit TctC
MRGIRVAVSGKGAKLMIGIAGLRTITAFLVGVVFLAQPAFAESKYPDRPIRFVVAFEPGGITDIVARLVAERLSASLGQSVVVYNRGGGAGAVGAKFVANAEPDGYTFLVTTTAVAIGAAASAANVDPRTKLEPLALVASSPTVLAAKAPTPARSLVDYVRSLKRPDITYATAGAGTVEHLTAAYVLKGISGVNATHVPYRSGGEALNAVIGEHVDLSSTPIGSAINFVQQKQLQLLGVASHSRLKGFPDTPTFAELGLPGIESASWVAVFGPPGLPPDIAQTINTEVNKALQAPDVGDRLRQLGFDTQPSTLQQFAQQVSSEVDRWRKVLADTGITLN